MRMKATDMRLVVDWLEKAKPNAMMADLRYVLEAKYGKIHWDSQAGYGEGLITATLNGVRGESMGDCTSTEAVLDLALKLIQKEASDAPAHPPA